MSSNFSYGPQLPVSYNTSVMVASVVVMFVVIVLLMCILVYAKMFWDEAGVAWSRRPPATGGLDRQAMDSLPTFTYKAKSQEEKEGQERKEEKEAPLECVVCLQDFQDSEEGKMLPVCKHSFHTECINMWFYSHSTCPICRVPVLAETAGPYDGPTPQLDPASVSHVLVQISGESTFVAPRLSIPSLYGDECSSKAVPALVLERGEASSPSESFRSASFRVSIRRLIPSRSGRRISPADVDHEQAVAVTTTNSSNTLPPV